MMTFNKTVTFTAALAAMLTLSACQSTSTSTSPVIQRANSTYETTGVASTKIKAQQNALDSAKKTCGSRQVVVVNDTTKYNGILGERTGRVIDQIGGIFGKNASDSARDDDYEYMINFRCQ